jgi:hypothetical protein
MRSKLLGISPSRQQRKRNLLYLIAHAPSSVRFSSIIAAAQATNFAQGRFL